MVPLPTDPIGTRQRVQLGSHRCPVVLDSTIQGISSYETVDGRRLLQDGLNIGRNRKPSSELLAELLNSEIKARLEGADVIVRLRLVDASLDQCHIETVAEPARASFKSLQHVADLTRVITVRLRLSLYSHSDDVGKQ